MEPVFTLQWPEFVVAERLQSLLPRKDGYSVFIPLSRQEKGIDLAVLHRSANGRTTAKTFQVKASRTHQPAPPKRKATIRFQHNTWFNCFNVPDLADYVILVGMYAPDLGRTARVSATWYKDCSLIFTRDEMREFFTKCRTASGKPDRMFGFGFNDMSKIVLNRGDMTRLRQDFSGYLLERRVEKLIRK